MKLLVVSILYLTLVGCAAGSNFKPVTEEGAICKVECGKSMASCYSSSYTCDRAVATCMASCKELDDIKSKN